MSNEIDPGSLNLGQPKAGDPQARPRFTASFLPTQDNAPAPVCALPDLTDFNLATTQLRELVPSCIPQFKDQIPLPPNYNPSAIRFAACEALTASTNITTCPTTRNSSLILRSSGPDTDPNGGPSECGLVLEGNLCVEACSSFTADTNVSFSGAAQNAESSLELIPSDQPNCGVLLRGNIHVDACAGVSVDTAVRLGSGLAGYLRVSPADAATNCGVVLEGELEMEGCASFGAANQFRLTGNIPQGQGLYLQAANAPDCGVVLAGDLDLTACKEMTAEANVDFTGDAVEGSSLELTASSAPDCGVQLSGTIDVKACTGFDVAGSFRIGGSAVKVNSPLQVSSTSRPNCGLTLDGDIEINACTELTVESDVKLAAPLSGKIELTPVKSEDGSSVCGLKLTADLDFNGGSGGGGVCTALSLKAEKPKDKDFLKFSPFEHPELTIATMSPPGMLIEDDLFDNPDNLLHPAADGKKTSSCGAKLSLSHQDNRVILPISKKPPFSCMPELEDTKVSGSDFLEYITKISIDRLEATTIGSNVCCAQTSVNYVDMCRGELYFGSDSAETTITHGSVKLKNFDTGALLDLAPPPDGLTASWQQVSYCVNGVTKNFYVLMTDEIP